MRALDSVHNLRHPHIHRDAGNSEGFPVMEAIKLHQGFTMLSSAL